MRQRNYFHPLSTFTMVIFAIAIVVSLWMAVAATLRLLGPLGSIALAAALVTFPTFVSRTRKSRQERTIAGYCGECGYDLRASSDLCPECGAPLSEEILRRRRLRAGTQVRQA